MPAVDGHCHKGSPPCYHHAMLGMSAAWPLDAWRVATKIVAAGGCPSLIWGKGTLGIDGESGVLPQFYLSNCSVLSTEQFLRKN